MHLLCLLLSTYVKKNVKPFLELEAYRKYYMKEKTLSAPLGILGL